MESEKSQSGTNLIEARGRPFEGQRFTLVPVRDFVAKDDNFSRN